MTTTTISDLIEREDNLKSELKGVRGELKAALEESSVYKNVLEATISQEVKQEKAAKAYALKVARASFATEEE